MIATKSVRLSDSLFTLSGLSADDPYFKGITDFYEPHFVKLCQMCIGSDYVCVDIGANIGVKTLILSGIASEGHVLAVEAAPSVLPLLRRNIEDNMAVNVAIAPCAIGDTDGEVGFNDYSAYGYITDGGVTVAARRLRTLLAEQGLARMDFVKIDVEGNEFAILRDSIDLLNAHRALVLLEYNAWCQMAYANVQPFEFARWLTSHFADVYLMRPRADQMLMKLSAGEAGAAMLLHTNITQDGAVSDVIVTNAPERLTDSSVARLNAAGRR